MIDQFFNRIFESGIHTLGSASLFCLFVMVIFFIGFLFLGFEFDICLVIISSIPYAFYKGGYIDLWISAIFIVIPLGFGIYQIWNKFNNKI
jgi:hypothetical protein